MSSPRDLHRLLLTGFEPFGDDPGALAINSSAAIVQGLDGQQIGLWRIEGHVLPCVYGASVRVLKRLIASQRSAAIIALGQAGGRSAISIERIAVNWDEADLPDNAGELRLGQRIVGNAPAAYFSTLPIHAMRDAVIAEGIAAELSSSAGHFVCNHLFFSMLHALRRTGIPAGFVHLPYLPEQAKFVSTQHAPSMSAAVMLAAMRHLIETLPRPVSS